MAEDGTYEIHKRPGIVKRSEISTSQPLFEYSVGLELQQFQLDVPSIVFVYLDDEKSSQIYNIIKKLSYNEFGIITQCVTSSKIESAKTGLGQMCVLFRCVDSPLTNSNRHFCLHCLNFASVVQILL